MESSDARLINNVHMLIKICLLFINSKHHAYDNGQKDTVSY